MADDALNAALVDAVRAVRPDVQAIYRFGSTLTEYVRPDSDLDAALLLPTPLSYDEQIRLFSEGSAAARRDLDIMDLGQAGPVAHFQVLHEGRPIYTADQVAVDAFEMRALREYQDYKIRRRPIEAHHLQFGFAA